MSPVLLVVTVLVAGMAGALVRHGAAVLGVRARFPVAILVVNAVGSLIAGLAMGFSPLLGPELSLIVLTGFCGGLTTFSTFSVDTVRLALEGRGWAALGNVLANLALGIGAASLGAGIAIAVL
jgi:CrcB protein